MARVILPFREPGTSYWQRTAHTYPATADLLARERVDMDTDSLVLWVPFQALRTGRGNLFDWADTTFAYPYKVLATLLMAAAHATARNSRVVVTYSTPADGSAGPEDGYYLVVYPLRQNGHEDDEGASQALLDAEDKDLTPHAASLMTADVWIARRFMSVSGIAALAELGCRPLPPPPKSNAQEEEDDEEGDAQNKKKKAPPLRLHQSEHKFWACLEAMFITGKLSAVVQQIMARHDDPYAYGGRNLDRQAAAQVYRADVAVQTHNYIGGGVYGLSAEELRQREEAHARELNSHYPSRPGGFVPTHPRLSFMVPPNRHHPGWIAEYRMPHEMPYVNIDDPQVVRWCNAAMALARANGQNPTFDEVLARFVSKHQTEVAHSPPPIYDWVDMMRARYKSGRESVQVLDQIFASQMASYMNPDNPDIGHCARTVCAWMEENMPRNTWADISFVQTHPEDDAFTAGMRMLQAVMNHGVCLSGGHELFRALIILISMERCSFSHEGGSSQVLATGLPGAGKSNIMTLFRKGCPPNLFSSTAWKSALADTSNSTEIGGIRFEDEATLGRLGISDTQKTDPSSALQLALNGGPTDCASKGNEVGANIDKQTLGGEHKTVSEMLVLKEMPDGTKVRVKQTSTTFRTGVSVGFSNYPFDCAPAIAQRTWGVFVGEDPRRKTVKAALLFPQMMSEELFAKWTNMNKRRMALFQLLHIGIAAGFLPDVEKTQLGLVLARFCSSMEAMSSPVITARIALRASRYIRWQAMDSGLLLFGLFENPTRSYALTDLRKVMALSSVTWSTIVSTVTLPDIGFGLGEVTRLVVLAIRDRFYRNYRDGYQLTGHVLSDRVPALEHLNVADFARYIAKEINSMLGGQLTPAQIVYQVGMMMNDRLCSATTAGRRVPLILRSNNKRIPHIEMLGAYLRNSRGPALDAIISCIPSSTELDPPQPDSLVFTSYVGTDGKYTTVRIPKRENPDDASGDLRDSEIEAEYQQLEDQLQQIGGEIDSLRRQLRLWVEGHAMQVASNLASTVGDLERARKEAEDARRHRERVFGTAFLAGERRADAPDDSELPDGLRELDPRRDPEELVAPYMAEKARIKGLLEEKQEQARGVSASMASLAMVNPVTLRRGLVATTSNARDATAVDRDYASKWGVELPEQGAEAELTDAGFSRAQLQACGFTPDEIPVHAGYAPNTRRLLAARAAVDLAFVALRDAVKVLLEREKAYAEARAGPDGDASELRAREEMRDSVGEWARLMRAVCKAGRIWQHTRQNMIGANSPLDFAWAQYWVKTHFGGIYKKREQAAVLESLATMFLAGCNSNLDLFVEAGVRCADSMGFLGISSPEVRAALRPQYHSHEEPAAAVAPESRRREREEETMHDSDSDGPDDSSDNGSRASKRSRVEDAQPVLSM